MAGAPVPLPQVALLVTGPDDIALAKAALAHRAGAALLVLVSPPGWGAGWWQALTGDLAAPLVALFDAGEESGSVLAALHAGCRDVAVESGRLPPLAAESLADIARQTGARLHPRPAGHIPVPRSNNPDWKARWLAEWLDAAAASGYGQGMKQQDGAADPMPSSPLPSSAASHPS
ncbi:hypothetical protein [Radicibacter daui]|uniref:hypothetical protein n=1 Tax=Radicibacter daui TaxID=3064829 RepID=UPI0040470483